MHIFRIQTQALDATTRTFFEAGPSARCFMTTSAACWSPSRGQLKQLHHHRTIDGALVVRSTRQKKKQPRRFCVGHLC